MVLQDDYISVIVGDGKIKFYPELLAAVRSDNKYHPIQALVQPYDPEVMAVAQVLVQAPDFISATQEFVNSFTTYQPEAGDFWRKPGETLAAEAGDCLCEDTPLIISRRGTPDIIEVADLMPAEYPLNHMYLPEEDVYILSGHHKKASSSSKTFAKINWLVKKNSDKDIYRINSNTCIFDVTSDHLLATRDGSPAISFVPASDLVIKRSKLLKTRTFSKSFSKRFHLGYDLGWVYGFFAAEGSIGNSYWRIFNTDKSLLERVKAILDEKKAKEGKLFGLRSIELEIKTYDCFQKGADTNFGPRGKTLWALVAKARQGYLKQVCNRFRVMFYTGLGNKKVPISVLHSDIETAKGFLDGFYAGDANTTTSKILAFGVALLSSKLGGNHLRIHDHAKNLELVKPITGKQIIVAKNSIRLIGKTDRPVYDLNLERPHIFCAGDVMVHNCDDKAILLASILRNYMGPEEAFCAFGLLTQGGESTGHMWVVTKWDNGEDRILESTIGPERALKGIYVIHGLFNDRYCFATDIGMREFNLRTSGV